ncbi:MAG: 30S ribosomal protein S8 [Deltaproteobacteria bacterium]|jgi:small subunit ribosomal protein S8|nr:30S ribosomal protein S8 [Deltaproteobacteria bacterium]
MDTIGQFLTSIRNAGSARLEKVDMPSSNMRFGIAKILQEEGYIKSFKIAKDSKQGIMRIYLKYDDMGKHIINKIQRVSTPGRRYYSKSTDIPNVRSGYGISILSTNKGVLSSKKAKQYKLGGEILCEVW